MNTASLIETLAAVVAFASSATAAPTNALRTRGFNVV
jgi:hypothetical protein